MRNESVVMSGSASKISEDFRAVCGSRARGISAGGRVSKLDPLNMRLLLFLADKSDRVVVPRPVRRPRISRLDHFGWVNSTRREPRIAFGRF